MKAGMKAADDRSMDINGAFRRGERGTAISGMSVIGGKTMRCRLDRER